MFPVLEAELRFGWFTLIRAPEYDMPLSAPWQTADRNVSSGPPIKCLSTTRGHATALESFDHQASEIAPTNLCHFAAANRSATSLQFTTFHQAVM
jgi:hypothetical protein